MSYIYSRHPINTIVPEKSHEHNTGFRFHHNDKKHKMKIIIYTLFLLLSCQSIAKAAAHNEDETNPRKPKSDANITGHVQNTTTKEHIPYITIVIKGTTIGAATDATGHYFLKNLPSGKFTIVASSLGYKTEEKTVVTTQGKTIELNFLLTEEAISMDDVVVTANRNETNKKETSSIVNISSAKLFSTVASSVLSESMNFQPGLRVENNCGNCAVTQLRINGLEGHYSQILLDSRPIFSSLAGVYGLDQLPVSMVERVEVVRGGGSALYGANAIGGVVNIITKEPLYNSVNVSNTTNIFPNGKLDTNTSLGGSFVSDDHKAGMYVFGMIKNRAPYDYNGDNYSDVPSISSETVGFRGYYRTGLYSRLSAEYHHIHEFRRGGEMLDTEGQNLFDKPPHEAMIAEQLNSNIDGGGVRFDTSTSDAKHRGSVFASAQNIARTSYFGTQMQVDSYGATHDKTFVGGGQYTYSMDKLLFMPAELMAGLEYSYNNLVDRYLGLERDMNQTTHVVGGFLQNEWKNKQLSFLLGGRIDKHNLMNKAVFSPRANVRYSPTDNIGVRASYSSGFRAPQAYDEDLHVDAVGGALKLIILAPGLKPEYSHSLSASVDLYHNFGRLQTNLLIEGFYTKLNDVFTLVQIGEDSDGNLIMERRNAPGATVKGINLEGKLGIPGIFELQLGYTFQRSLYDQPFSWSESTDVNPQRRMFRTPDNYGYFTSFVNITPSLRLSLFGTYTGNMLVQHTKYNEINGTYTDTETITQSFFDLGTKVAYTFRLSDNISLELNAGVKNILDSYQTDLDFGSHKDAGYVYGPALPRMIFVGAKFSM